MIYGIEIDLDRLGVCLFIDPIPVYPRYIWCSGFLEGIVNET